MGNQSFGWAPVAICRDGIRRAKPWIWTLAGLVIGAAALGAAESIEVSEADVLDLVTLDRHILDRDRPMVVRAMQVFFSKGCPDLYRARHDLHSVQVLAFSKPLANYQEEMFGWSLEIEVIVRAADSMTRGHTLQYFLGAGNRPGIVAQKQIAASVCAMEERGGSPVFPGTEGSDIFLPLTDLAFLDEPGPPSNNATHAR